MAKQKTTDDQAQSMAPPAQPAADVQARTPDAPPAPPELPAEAIAQISKLQGRIAELEAANALAIARVETPDGVQGGGTGYWRVELQNAPTHVVMARDAANAWDAYKREMGVLTSEYQPKVYVASKEDYAAAQRKRLGVEEPKPERAVAMAV